ncbi:MAG: DUF4440 domain-containing protein [Phenylobacterium sp.]|uniref:YybH family protein n=1 Tax=Phenylobacterium sp. TaxID=1871053 RepID=UPI0027346D5C|nr:DUF4440 domain-containing protein [Phenylobacterium sp.]MDP3746365.1 DUF4440 domain-containing protein [Phenylobacterium sp.]
MIGALFLVGCGSQPQERTAIETDAVRAADASLQQAVTARDLSKIMAFYADTAILMPTAEPKVIGKAAIEEEWKHILAIPAFENRSKLERVEVSASNDLAYTMGVYTSRLMGEDDKIVEEPGKWLTVWKKQADGRWRVIVETYNTDIPPPDHR